MSGISPEERRFYAGVVTDDGDYIVDHPVGQTPLSYADAKRGFLPDHCVNANARQVVFEVAPFDELEALRSSLAERDRAVAQRDSAVELLRAATDELWPRWVARRDAFLAEMETT